jgi:hypothetical protein
MSVPQEIIEEAAKLSEMKRNPNSLILEVSKTYEQLLDKTAGFFQDQWLNDWLDDIAPNPTFFDLFVACPAEAIKVVDLLVEAEDHLAETKKREG